MGYRTPSGSAEMALLGSLAALRYVNGMIFRTQGEAVPATWLHDGEQGHARAVHCRNRIS